mgnify:CR=1 FL=1
MREAVKTLGVAWVGALTFALAFFVSMALDRLTPPLDESKSKTRVFLEVCVQFGIVGAILYWSRVLIKNVPFPLDGLYGYEHANLGELRSLPLFVFIFMFFQKRAQEKMRYVST